MTVRTRIIGLYIYPVKALGGVELTSSIVNAQGLEWDRRWMLVDAAGHFITQRQLPELAAIRVRLLDNELQLVSAEGRRLHLPFSPPTGALVETKVHGNTCYGVDEGDEAATWFEQALGASWSRGFRLLRFAADHHQYQQHQRRIGQERLKAANLSHVDAHTGFADGYPLLVTSESSLKQVNEALISQKSSVVEMSRFRPNIVVSGLPAFEEHQYPWLQHSKSDLLLWAGKPCERCPVTKVDQISGVVMDRVEPLSVLKSLSPFEGTAIFGVNAIPVEGNPQVIKVGDEVIFCSSHDTSSL